jgi:hypothetical protein
LPIKVSPDISKLGCSFVDGFDDVRCQPDYAKSAGLNHRFAIIQETYRPDCVDMYFDEPLWLSLLEFVKRTSTNVQIGVTQNSSKKVALENFLADFSKLPNEERHPPPLSSEVKRECSRSPLRPSIGIM